MTLADPTSPYSFLQYLKETGRLYPFYIRETLFPLRTEYDDVDDFHGTSYTILRQVTNPSTGSIQDLEFVVTAHVRYLKEDPDTGELVESETPTYRKRVELLVRCPGIGGGKTPEMRVGRTYAYSADNELTGITGGTASTARKAASRASASDVTRRSRASVASRCEASSFARRTPSSRFAVMR